jgi:hypothetical protein
MTIKIYNEISGRFGNSIFRYIASIVFCILYEGEITYDIDETTYIMTDDVFQVWMGRLLDEGVLEPMKRVQNGEENGDGVFFETNCGPEVYNAKYSLPDRQIQKNTFRYMTDTTRRHYTKSNMYNRSIGEIYTNIDENDKTPAISQTMVETERLKPCCFLFHGYFQFDRIYNQYRDQIVDWIRTHPDQQILSDDFFTCRALNLIEPLGAVPQYNIVVHLRFKDFLSLGWVVHPVLLENVLNQILSGVGSSSRMCFVVEKPVFPVEHQYLQYFQSRYKNIVFQSSSSILEDYHCIRHAKILVCCYSTFSWSAGFLSNILEKVYMPDCVFQTDRPNLFKTPCSNNTIYYPSKLCNMQELKTFFNTVNPSMLNRVLWQQRLEPMNMKAIQDNHGKHIPVLFSSKSRAKSSNRRLSIVCCS